MRRPEGDAFGNLRDDLAIVRLAFLEGEFQADFIVLRPTFGQRLEQRCRLYAALGVEFGGKGPVPPLSIRLCLMWMIGDTGGTARAQA